VSVLSLPCPLAANQCRQSDVHQCMAPVKFLTHYESDPQKHMCLAGTCLVYCVTDKLQLRHHITVHAKDRSGVYISPPVASKSC
jgi:hypothetical protein